MLTTLATITEGNATVAGFDVARSRRSPQNHRDSASGTNRRRRTQRHRKPAPLSQTPPCPKRRARKKAKELLELLELEGAAQRQVKTFSGGMRRRLQLAMGLIHEPKILFLDEPTLGLDIQTRQNMWTYIRRLNRENGITVFMTTHYLEEADSLCDRIAIIDAGAIKLSGAPFRTEKQTGRNSIYSATYRFGATYQKRLDKYQRLLN